MNKKAQFFMPLFVIVTLIIFTTLYLDFAAKTEQFECKDFSSYACKIGEKQLAVLNTAAEGEKALLYIDIAAKYAYANAVLDVAHSGYITEEMTCGTYRGVPIVYGNADCMSYNEDLNKEIEQALSEKFNDAFVAYAEAYQFVTIPSNNYDLSIKDNIVYGTAQEEMEIPIFSLTSIAVEEKTAEQTYASGTAFTQWPVAIDEHAVVSCFGYRGDKIKTKSGVKASTNHNGIDIRAPKGTFVLAIADGVVTQVSPINWGYVTIDHGNGIFSRYLHLDTITVSKGEQITKGQQIGTAGGRGKNGNPDAYASHLHFSIIDTNIDSELKDAEGNSAVLSENTVNPLCYLSQELQYTYYNNLGCRSQGGAYKFCSLYHPQVSVSAIGEYTISESAQERLHYIDTTYGAIIDKAIAGTIVPKGLVVGTIMQESGGNPNAGSQTGCMGLMQFCGSTAKEYGLCSNTKCSGIDERTDPIKAIPAGVQLLQDNLNIFSSYTDKVEFAVASYNGGAGGIKNAIEKTGKTNPTWEEVSVALDASCITHFKTTEDKNNKVIEIRNYVPRVLGYASAYEQLQNTNDINSNE